MFKLFKRNFIHKHDWELVAVNDKYHTTYTDTGKTEYWQMRFYKCSCGDRKYENNYASKYTTHEGMEKAKKNWIDIGVVPTKSYHPADDTNYVKIDEIEREKLDPVLEYQRTLQDMVDSLGVVINRDFDLEVKYPELKAAADEYHRKLDKYRTFDTLKE